MSNNSTAVFTAITFSAHTVEYLQSVAEALDILTETTSCVPEPKENFHLTLNYLPAVTDMEALIAKLSEVRAAPFCLRVGDLGLFQNPSSAVVWAGVDGDTAQLQALKMSVDEACEGAGYPREHREYRPHITLAYADRAKLTGAAWGTEAPADFRRISVDRFHLLRVVQGERGTSFQCLRTVQFQ